MAINESQMEQNNKAKMQDHSMKHMSSVGEFERRKTDSNLDGSSSDTMDNLSKSETRHLEFA